MLVGVFRRFCWCVFNPGPIPMFIGSELFRQGPRPKAMAVVGVALWLGTFVIAMGFEPLQVIRYRLPARSHTHTSAPTCVIDCVFDIMTGLSAMSVCRSVCRQQQLQGNRSFLFKSKTFIYINYVHYWQLLESPILAL